MKSISLVVTVMFLALLAGGTLAFGQNLEARGIELSNAGQFDQAISTFTQGLNQKPNDPNLHYLRGKAYTAKGQYGQALEDFSAAIKLKPDYGQAYFGRAMVYVYQEKYDQALEDLHQAERNGYKDADFLKLVRKRAGEKR
ncbi:MAG: tetratricopeptide repeat protein [Thermodesulfobacteriota bacterium]